MPKLVKVYKLFEMNYKRREEFKNNIEYGKEIITERNTSPTAFNSFDSFLIPALLSMAKLNKYAICHMNCKQVDQSSSESKADPR